jgi:uncharacterized integral membrane protein
MLFLVVLTVVAVLVAVGALQNGQAVTVSFFFWQFQSPLALIILAAATGGVAMGILVGWARALWLWGYRPVRSAVESDASAPDRLHAAGASLGARMPR